MSILPPSGIYAITDCENFPGSAVISKTEIMLENGIALLQYRNKNRRSPEYSVLAERLLALCRRYGCPLVVNDDPQLAGDIEADGLHLGERDISIDEARCSLGKGKLIGYSCYNRMERAVYAERSGADYVALGAFHSSPTKPGAARIGLSQLQKTRRAVSLPIIAIGGITPENGREIVQAGADMLAVVSGLYRAADIARAVRLYRASFG